VIEFLGKRPAIKNQSLVGSVSAASRFEDTRKSLYDKLSDAVKTHVDIDDASERIRVIGSLQQAARITVALELGAAMLGLASAVQIVDMVIGMGACTFLAGSGGLVLSQGRRRVVWGQ